MTLISNTIFGPMTPKVEPELLQPQLSQLAQNLKHTSGALEGWRLPAAVAGVTMPGATAIKTIYRFGKSTASKTNYWFQFTGDVDIVKGPVNSDTEERTYWTDGAYPKKTKSSMAGLTAGVAITPSSLRMGVPPPGWAGPLGARTYTPVASVSGAATDPGSTPLTSTYVVTYISSWDEESAPSNPSNVVTWRAGQTVTISMPGTIAGAYDITQVRVYRSNTGTNRTAFQFVADAAVGVGSYADTAVPSALGEACPSFDWLPPLDNMIGLTDMGNGILAGFENNTVHFCEPYYPYAWPDKYDVSLSAKIVGMKAFGQTLVVGTTEGVVLISGIDPGAMSQDSGKGSQALVSKRGMVEMMGGVVFPTPDGLQYVGAAGVNDLTGKIMSRDQWQIYCPSDTSTTFTFDGYTINGRYYAFYDNGVTQGCLIFSFGEDAGFVLCDQWVTAAYLEQRMDALFVVQRVSTTNTLKQWDAGSAMTVAWRSKPHRSRSGNLLTCAKVEAAGYPLTFKLYEKGVLTFTKTVASEASFRLPPGRRYAAAYQIESTNKVTFAGMATSMHELSNG